MITYKYSCNACGYEFEKIQAISSKVMKKCPKCKKLRLNRLIGSGLIVFVKGTNTPVKYSSNKCFKPPIGGKPEHIKF